jgi:hypothetical protein
MDARRTAFERWPIAAIRGGPGRELRAPAHFERAAEMISEGDVARSDPQLPCDNNFHELPTVYSLLMLCGTSRSPVIMMARWLTMAW